MELVSSTQAFTFRPAVGTMMEGFGGGKGWAVSAVTVSVVNGELSGVMVDGPSGTGRSRFYHPIQIDALEFGHFVKEASARALTMI